MIRQARQFTLYLRIAIPPGTRLGAYEILSALGAGGMGEVYRARDSKLKREVALKVLPADVANDRERLARFQREAEVLASLNHPHIAHIHGLEESGETIALVMELVEGEDLSQRIARGAIPIDEALPIARQIAEALEAAHDAGIVHRDLKPGNIKVRDDGTVKVLDFGLAKALDQDPKTSRPQDLSNSPTITSPAMTMRGVILGTAAYMAPEQAKGKPVDRRADIWAFGCVLYEMLTGTRAFPGDEMADVLAAVINREPDLTRLPASTPSGTRAVLARCLVKDRRERLRDIGDARLFLDDRAPAEVATAGAGSRSKLVLVLAAGLAVALMGLAVSLVGRGESTAPASMRLSITFPDGAPAQQGQPLPSLALSPDGRTLVYTAGGGPEGNQLWLRPLNEFASTPIAGTGSATVAMGSNPPVGRQAFFSPDGKWIGFVAGNSIKKVPITMGPPSIICDFFDGVNGATWTDRNEIVFASATGSKGLWRVSAGGGIPERVAEGDFYYPDALPGGAAVVVTQDRGVAERSAGDLSVAAVTLATGAVAPLFDGGTYARYVNTGHVVFARDGALMAAPFNAATLTVGEARTPVVPDLWMDPAVPSSNYAVSASGALVYAPGSGAQFERTIVVLEGDVSTPLVEDRRYYSEPRLSPNGGQLAIVERAWRDRIWVIDLARRTFTQLASGRFPVWAPGGREIAFSAVALSAGPGLYVASVDGNRPPFRVFASASQPIPSSFTRDGRQLVFWERHPNTGADLMIVSLDQGNAVRPLLQTPFDESRGAISPDGQLIAYESGRSGTTQIYVSEFPSMQGAVQVSINGGQLPVWAPDRRRLYFRRGRNVMAIDIAGLASVSRPAAVATYPATYPTAFIDPMPGGRLLALDGVSIGGIPELRVILNWHEELKQRVPVR